MVDAPAKRPRWRKLLARIVIFAAILYLGALFLVYQTQRAFIYHPYDETFEVLSSRATEQGFSPWTNSAGLFIGWKRLSRAATPAGQLLILHGNGGNATYALDVAGGLLQNGDWDLYTVEYPGYGTRPGSPTEQGLFDAGREAVEILKGRGPLCLMGISLGTGVASYLASVFPNEIRGVLLVAPYDNLVSVGRLRMPMFPVSLMLKDKFASDEYLKKYHGPVGMIFGGRDNVVPNRFGHRLLDGYNGPKKWWQIENAGHGDLLDQPKEWWKELADFWNANPAPK